MDGHLKEVVDEILEKQCLDVLLAVGRDLVLLVVQLSEGRFEISIFLLYLLSLALLLTFDHIISLFILISHNDCPFKSYFGGSSDSFIYFDRFSMISNN